MIEARVFVDSLEEIESILAKHKTEFMGDYEIIDEIYHSKDSSRTLNDELLRLRVMPQNIWNTKSVIIAVKRTNLQNVGKVSEIPLKLEFDTEATARDYLQQKMLDDYEYDFSFNRTGRQYIFENGDVIDLELIEGHPSVEFKSRTDHGIKALLRTFNISSGDVLLGPSIIGVKEVIGQI